MYHSFMPGMYHYYFDPTYILVIIGALLCMFASFNVNHTFKKYNRKGNSRHMTGEQIASEILSAAGITDVRIEHVSGNLTDHFDPSARVVRLSDSVYGSTSIAAAGVAAHECGHVIQHEKGYVPIKVRNAIVPIVNIGSKLSWPIMLVGLLLGALGLVKIGILLFSLTLLFQVVTLPVEFNASGRALHILEDHHLLYDEELSGARKVLTAAACTYVASAISTLLQLVRLLLIFNRRDD